MILWNFYWISNDKNYTENPLSLTPCLKINKIASLKSYVLRAFQHINLFFYLFFYLFFCCFRWVLKWRNYLPKGLPRRWCLTWKPKPFSLAPETPFKITPLVPVLFLVMLMNCDLIVYSHILYKPLQDCDYRPKKIIKNKPGMLE